MSKRKKNQRNSSWVVYLGMSCLGLLTAVIAWLLRGRDIALLNPKGTIADEQYWLLVVSTSIMLGFAAIVLFFIYFFAWRYRETNDKAVHKPQAGRSKLLLLTAWAAPITIFVVLSGIMLPATQRLEPQRSIKAENDEMIVRVIAMRWKWLFLYPEQDIATVNYVQIPVDTPVRFELTADEAPMQSFWIPHLGGMLYAMTEHINPLNLMAHTIGEYDGGAAEINGHGFAGMRFTANVTSRADFDAWASRVATDSDELDATRYAQLLEPTEFEPAAEYRSPANRDLFDALVKKYAGSHNHYGDSSQPESGGHH